MATKIDWLEAKKDYLSDPTQSYRSIAEKYGVSDTAVEGRAREEGWAKLRKELGDQASSKAVEQIVDEMAEINKTHREAFLRGRKLGELLETAIYNATVKAVEDAVKAGHTVNIKELVGGKSYADYMAGLKTAIDGERTVLGLATNVTKSENEYKMVDEFSKYTEEELQAILDDNLSDDADEYTDVDEPAATNYKPEA